ncbi:MAG: Adaptive-response sensory-kinase SasA [Planctomycetes bacterium]|nr:Adaptive-response sensory-kinase SasA [Planctomycetota bacterium]
MSLRAKLLLAQVPLLAALVLLAVVAMTGTTAVARASDRILFENYRTVLYVQSMNEAVERINELAGTDRGGAGAADAREPHRSAFELALAGQEDNLTEPGEGEATRDLRSAWEEWLGELDALRRTGDAERAQAFDVRARPVFVRIKDSLERLRTLNQDAMRRKSEAAQATARRVETILGVATVLGCAAAIAATVHLTTRILRPLALLGDTAMKIGDGDLAVRAQVGGRDEIARLAGRINDMAEKLALYRKSTLGELLEAQAAMQAAIDSLPDPVVVMATSGELLHLNLAAERVLGVVPEKGAAAFDAMSPPLREAVERIRKHVVSGHGAYTPAGIEEAIRVEPRDAETHLILYATPVYSLDGAVVATTVLFQDVSRLIRSERRHTDLLATVAHEFRTPLQSLGIAIHMCTEGAAGELTAKQNDLLHAARDDCERLERLVEEFLQVAHVESGETPQRTAPVDPEELVRATIASHERVAAERQVALEAEVLPDLPKVSVDRERVLVAVDNLVVNAIRFAPEGSVVTVRARTVGGSIRFEVEDRGPGVPPEYRESIFERNIRVPGAPGSGAGMGLYIARENVKSHGGKIGVESMVGRGSTFWIELPAAPEPEAPAA